MTTAALKTPSMRSKIYLWPHRTTPSCPSIENQSVRCRTDYKQIECKNLYLDKYWRISMSLGMILLIVVVLMLIGAIPSWPHSRSWGYGPSGILGTVLIVLLVLLIIGRI